MRYYITIQIKYLLQILDPWSSYCLFYLEVIGWLCRWVPAFRPCRRTVTFGLTCTPVVHPSPVCSQRCDWQGAGPPHPPSTVCDVHNKIHEISNIKYEQYFEFNFLKSIELDQEINPYIVYP